MKHKKKHTHTKTIPRKNGDGDRVVHVYRRGSARPPARRWWASGATTSVTALFGESRTIRRLFCFRLRAQAPRSRQAIRPPNVSGYRLPQVASYGGTPTISRDHSKQDPRCSQKPLYFPIFTDKIWSYLLWSPVILLLLYSSKVTSSSGGKKNVVFHLLCIARMIAWHVSIAPHRGQIIDSRFMI